MFLLIKIILNKNHIYFFIKDKISCFEDNKNNLKFVYFFSITTTHLAKSEREQQRERAAARESSSEMSNVSKILKELKEKNPVADQLISMGFPMRNAVAAVETCGGNLEKALDWLLNGNTEPSAEAEADPKMPQMQCEPEPAAEAGPEQGPEPEPEAGPEQEPEKKRTTCTLYIKDLMTKENLVLKVYPHTRVWGIKNLISQMTKYETEDQQIIYAEKSLDDNNTLEMYKYDGDQLFLRVNKKIVVEPDQEPALEAEPAVAAEPEQGPAQEPDAEAEAKKAMCQARLERRRATLAFLLQDSDANNAHNSVEFEELQFRMLELERQCG